MQSLGFALAAGVAASALLAVINRRLSAKAERRHPPIGNFVDVRGVRLHYVERGSGPAIVLLHGNGSMVQDFASSGLIKALSETNTVIAFDRPGYGYSNRPRRRIWTPGAQADLIEAALTKMGVSDVAVIGHSWGCAVAVALGLKHPALVRSLLLISGYYFPTVRLDAVTLSVPALPIVGDALRFTLSPILARLAWPLLLRKLFAPARVTKRFRKKFPKELTFRPSQIRSSSAESGLMVPSALAARGQYTKLKMPVVIVAGEGDRVVDIDRQSARLHSILPNSIFHRVPAAGHMVHHTSLPELLAAIRSYC